MPLSAASAADVLSPLMSEKNKKPQLFKDLNKDTFQKILSLSRIQNYKTGQIIVQQGDVSSYLYLIIEGHVRTLRVSPEGGEATIRMLDVGETCMEAVIFMGGPSPISMQTTKKSRLLLIPRDFVKSLALKDPQFANNLLGIVTHHYKSAMHQIAAMTIKTPLQRVGYYFLQRYIEQSSNNMGFELPFKKSTIANHLGMTPETFSRSLTQIKAMGIEIKNDKIRMKDAYVLCNFCDLDTAHTCPLSSNENCPRCYVHGKNCQ